MPAEVLVERWSGPDEPTVVVMENWFRATGRAPLSWSNPPGEVYVAHRHGYDKVLWVLAGRISIGLPESGQRFSLSAGDRLWLPAGTLHDAIVGPDGVTCIEAAT